MKEKSTNSNRRNFLLKGMLAALPLSLIGMNKGARATALPSSNSTKSVDDEIASLKHELDRVRSVNEIMKLQARYETIHASDEGLAWMLFADRPDSSKEITAEKYIGFDQIKQSSPPSTSSRAQAAGEPGPGEGGPGGEPSGEGGPGGPGGAGPDSQNIPEEYQRYHAISAMGQKFTIHPVATPCIEVAGDGQTAKATYTSLGFEGDMWCYGKYANSYIKIDGEWYIWHMKWLRCFKSPYDTCWADQTLDAVYEFTNGERDENGNPVLAEGINYDYLLAPDKELKTITAPRPYDTWTDADEDGAWWKKVTEIP